MIIEANGVGAKYAIPNESFIAEMSFGVSGLRVIVDTGFKQVEDSLWIEYHFDVPRGFRYLDEGELLRYWGEGTFASGHHLYEITAGGWKAQELQFKGMLNVTNAVGTFREWFICTANTCLNVLSVEPPLIRELRAA